MTLRAPNLLDRPIRLAARWLRRCRSLSRQIPDREHEIGLNRFAFGVIGNGYLSITHQHISRAALLSDLVYMTLALAVLVDLFARRRPSAVRRGVMIAADMIMISVAMRIGGQATSLFYPLYLWAIFGNGFRFGTRYLFAATACGTIGFAVVADTTPFWRAIPTTACGLLAALIILPTYTSTLIMKLSAASRAAEAASRAKGMFLASISHEFRTPLNAILGSVSLLDGTTLDREQRDLTVSLQSGTRRLLDLINDVLDFSRLDAGRMPVEPTTFALAPLLAEISTLLMPQVRTKRLRLSLHVAPDVPELVTIDRRHLYEILLNLASNAVKFTETGGVVIHITRDDGADLRSPLRFSVVDSGIGLKQSSIETIFESFVQADGSIIDRFGGTGLGLAICKRLVTLMAGQIGVSSEPGRGSTFWFTLDAAPDVARLALAGPMPAAHVLLLIDDPTLQLEVRRRLLVAGLTSSMAHGLDDAAQMMRRHDGRCVVLLQRDDAVALGQDCDRLAALDPAREMPCILLSARPVAADARGIALHVDTSVAPTLSDDALPNAIGLALALHPQRRAEAEPAPVAARMLRLLVADDNAINRQVVSKILERAGHGVTLVENGDQALEALLHHEFDLVLMDVNMPVLNGLDATVLHRLSETAGQHLPIVALTADPTEEMQQRCRAAGMDRCITKPIEPRRLVALIETMVAVPEPHPAARAGDVAQLAEHPRFRPALPAFDRQVLAELEALGGGEFVADLLQAFVVDADMLIRQIEDAVDGGDMAEFRTHVHALRSVAANIGAKALHECAGSSRALDSADLRTVGAEIGRRLRHEHQRLKHAHPALATGVGKHAGEIGQSVMRLDGIV